MSNVKTVWATPDADTHLAYIARVSNPDNQDNPSIEGLMRYMMREGHTSPFEMCHVCLEINTTRDIGRQILRHRSFSFQEFSQRYADVSALPEVEPRECRMQDVKNRQNSIENEDADLNEWWRFEQEYVMANSLEVYAEALKRGVAKEQARVILPEGLTASRMYMVGSFRSWIFYLKQRLHPSTQKEHRLIAQEVLELLRAAAPVAINAFFPIETTHEYKDGK